MTINSENDLVLAGMKKKRDFVMSQLKVHLDYVTQFNPEQVAIENLETRSEMLEETMSDFKKIHGEIQDYIKIDAEDEIVEVTEAYSKFSNEFCLVKGMIKRHISKNKEKSVLESRAPEITKLPPVPIPEFSGDIKDWVSFRDTFQAIVINQRISEVVKFHYLRESLKSGEAWKLISEMTPTEDTFKLAWETIEKRYDNKNIIVDSHVNELFRMKSVACDNSKDLWKLVEHFGTHLKALESLGEPIKHWDTLVIHMIKYRLDDKSKSMWEEKTISMENRPTWKDLETFLMERSRVLENLESTKRRVPKNQPEKNTNSFFASSSSSYKCACCGLQHKIQECRKFVTLKFGEKQELIKKRGLCFKCLLKGHISTSCDKTCEMCGGNHHKTIHLEKSKKIERPKMNAKHTSENSEKTEDVLMMTANIKVMKNDGEWMEARALLDSGSQSNFISENLLKKLQIESKPTNISINGIAGTAGKTNKKITTRIKSNHTEYEKSIELLVTSQIVERTPVSRINYVKSDIPKNVAQNLADEFFAEPKKIDLLLGVEVFLETLQMEQEKVNGGLPIFQRTKFGWIAAGRLDKTKKTTDSNN